MMSEVDKMTPALLVFSLRAPLSGAAALEKWVQKTVARLKQ